MTVLTHIHRALLASALGFALTACSQAGGETNPSSADIETAEPVSDPAETPTQYDLTARFADKGIEYGAPDAPVTLVEYASLTCGACKNFHDSVMPTIKEDYVKTGKVKFVLREFPTPPVQIALAGFVTARCAGEEKHMAVVDDFFARQNEIFDAARAGQADPALVQLAGRHGLSESAFRDCLADLDIRRDIAAAIEAGEADGVNATPTIFLNGEKLGSLESRTPDGLSALIDAAIAATETTEASDDTSTPEPTTAPDGEQ